MTLCVMRAAAWHHEQCQSLHLVGCWGLLIDLGRQRQHGMHFIYGLSVFINCGSKKGSAVLPKGCTRLLCWNAVSQTCISVHQISMAPRALVLACYSAEIKSVWWQFGVCPGCPKCTYGVFWGCLLCVSIMQPFLSSPHKETSWYSWTEYKTLCLHLTASEGTPVSISLSHGQNFMAKEPYHRQKKWKSDQSIFRYWNWKQTNVC